MGGRMDLCFQDLVRAEQHSEARNWVDVVRGIAMLSAGEAGGAVAAVERALAASPDLVVALLARSCALRSSGDLAAAVLDLSQVIELEPDNADAFAARGDDRLKLGDFSAAIQDFDRAMALAGQSPALTLRYLGAQLLFRQLEERQAAEVADEIEPPNEATLEWMDTFLSKYGGYPGTRSEGG